MHLSARAQLQLLFSFRLARLFPKLQYPRSAFLRLSLGLPFTSSSQIFAGSSPAMSSALQENRLHASQLRDFVICPVCQLRQFERGHATCVRCHCSLGITYIDIFTVNPQAGLYCGKPIDAQIRVGGIIRRLRLRRGITQAVLASLTGIHRTYLSRAERGRVLPSVFTLMQIASALGVDKISLRIRNARSTDRQQS
jgi:DNA-binding XRE family transcriptional regulator